MSAGLLWAGSGVLVNKCEFQCVYFVICFLISSTLCTFPAFARLFMIAPVLKSLIGCNNIAISVVNVPFLSFL